MFSFVVHRGMKIKCQTSVICLVLNILRSFPVYCELELLQTDLENVTEFGQLEILFYNFVGGG